MSVLAVIYFGASNGENKMLTSTKVEG